MHETVHLVVAGLALGVFKARIDRVEQLAVPAGALARQDQQLVSAAHAVEAEDGLLLGARIALAEALGAPHIVAAAVQKEEADVVAVARRELLGGAEQRRHAGGVGVDIVLLRRAVFEIRQRADQQHEKERQRQVRKAQREGHAEGDREAEHQRQHGRERLIEQIGHRPRRAEDRRQRLAQRRIVVRGIEDARPLGIARDDVHRLAAVVELCVVAERAQLPHEVGAHIFFFLCLAPHGIVPRDALRVLVHRQRFSFFRSANQLIL